MSLVLRRNNLLIISSFGLKSLLLIVPNTVSFRPPQEMKSYFIGFKINFNAITRRSFC